MLYIELVDMPFMLSCELGFTMLPVMISGDLRILVVDGFVGSRHESLGFMGRRSEGGRKAVGRQLEGGRADS